MPLLYYKYMTDIDLTERQKAILEYVRKYPNSTIKERIIAALTEQGLGSRKTILNDIKTLEGYSLLRVDKEKPNSQVHYVSIREDSTLLKVMEEVDHLTKTFSSLIDASKGQISYLLDECQESDWSKERSHSEMIEFINQIEKSGKPVDPETGIHVIQESLLNLFQHLIGVYMLYSVFVWPRKVQDKVTFDRLYTVVFGKIKELGFKLSEVLQQGYTELMIGEIVDQIFTLKPHKLDETLRYFENHALDKYAHPVLDSLWKASLPFIGDALLYNYQCTEEVREDRLKLIDEWKLADWRQVLKRKRHWNKENWFTYPLSSQRPPQR